MSHTKRSEPLKHLTKKEEELLKKHKFNHGLQLGDEIVHDQNAKKIAKRTKHHKERNLAKKEIHQDLKDVG